MTLVDVIVLILVAAFIVTRFTKFNLPHDPRDKHARRQDWGRLTQSVVNEDAPLKPKAPPVAPKTVGKGPAKTLTDMDKLKLADPAFSEAAFLDGARGAYAYFYSAWNDKDEEALANLCAPALVDRIVAGWGDKNGWSKVSVEDITSAALGKVRLHGKTAIAEVDFVARQQEGRGVAREVRSRWTLARALTSDDPNWEVQDIVTKADA